MAGLYIHIPFCRRRCAYCDFYFVTNGALIERFLVALEEEINVRADLFADEAVSTIYFGGGTPSMLSALQLGRILSILQKKFRLDSDLELTLEANPEDLSESLLQDYLHVGINRLSIGTQAFNDAKLKRLSREHTAAESRASVETARRWFENVSLDLIFGTEGETLSDWERELDTAVSLSPEHISAYSLTIEPFTPLAKLIERGKRTRPNDSLQTEMFLLAMEFLEAHGYEHYEVSNYAQSGFRSRHNVSYWTRVPYLGFGPSAHSFFRQSGKEIRFANQARLQRYLENPHGVEDFREALSDIDRFNETVLLSLRRREGLGLELLRKNFNFAALHFDALSRTVADFERDGLLTTEHDIIKLTRKGFTLADTIASEFFITEHQSTQDDAFRAHSELTSRELNS
ncbi:MAG: radical SAM family heme chaperone HemW [Chloroherpetonaceae bacterium]